MKTVQNRNANATQRAVYVWPLLCGKAHLRLKAPIKLWRTQTQSEGVLDLYTFIEFVYIMHFSIFQIAVTSELKQSISHSHSRKNERSKIRIQWPIQYNTTTRLSCTETKYTGYVGDAVQHTNIACDENSQIRESTRC